VRHWDPAGERLAEGHLVEERLVEECPEVPVSLAEEHPAAGRLAEELLVGGNLVAGNLAGEHPVEEHLGWGHHLEEEQTSGACLAWRPWAAGHRTWEVVEVVGVHRRLEG
jgi:hypothetical protein